jgi:hypothetical protein
LHACVLQASEEGRLLGLVQSSCVVQIRACERVGGGCIGREPSEDVQGAEELHNVFGAGDEVVVFCSNVSRGLRSIYLDHATSSSQSHQGSIDPNSFTVDLPKQR